MMNSHSSLHIPLLTPSVSCFIQMIWRAKQESTSQTPLLPITTYDVNMQGFVKFDDYQLLSTSFPHFSVISKTMRIGRIGRYWLQN